MTLSAKLSGYEVCELVRSYEQVRTSGRMTASVSGTQATLSTANDSHKLPLDHAWHAAYQEEACASCSIDTMSITATTALTGAYCAG